MNYHPFFKIAGNNKLGLLLLADHATATIPQEYDNLALPEKELKRHIAYDIGVENLTRALAEKMSAPALLSNFSRLLIDPNRGIHDPTLIMQLSDGAIIPKNYPMTKTERENRLKQFYHPYDNAIHAMLTEIEQASKPNKETAFIVSIHSFTPCWRGKSRPWHIGLLWDSDPRVAKPLLTALRQDKSLNVGDNEPYDGALIGDTMHRHATTKGRAHILIEVRQDLISDEKGVQEWAERLAPILLEINDLAIVHQTQFFPSRCDNLSTSIHR